MVIRYKNGPFDGAEENNPDNPEALPPVLYVPVNVPLEATTGPPDFGQTVGVYRLRQAGDSIAVYEWFGYDNP